MHEMASKLHDTTGRADAADDYALRYHDDHDALWRGAIKCERALRFLDSIDSLGPFSLINCVRFLTLYTASRDCCTDAVLS